MPNQKTHKPAKPLGKPQNRRRMFVGVSLLLSLMIASAALAQWSTLWSAPQKSQKQSAEIVPTAFTPANPAKEMAYAGGKLIATEEPQGGCIVLSATSQSFAESTPPSGAANTGSFTFTATCNWTVSTNVTFITITSSTSGSGNGTVNFTVANNTQTAIRSGIITVAGPGSSQTFTVYQGIAYTDVPRTHPFYTLIGRLSAKGLALGCTPGNFCPDQPVTRQEMARLIIGGLNAPGFIPPIPAFQRFNDVPPSNSFYGYIEEMAVRQITAGCSASPPLYCPGDPVTREQMAAFFIRSLHEPGYVPPPPASQRFNDVPPANPFYRYIEEMAVLNITAGCSASPPLYCPGDPVTRAQMAAFVVKAFNL